MHTLITTLATIVVPGVACLIVPYLMIISGGSRLERPFGFIQLLALGMAAVGLYMILWVSTAFVRRGKGTPVPIDPPARLVIEGLYRRVRNPMYTGALLVILAWAVYFGSFRVLLYAAGLWAALHAFVVLLEEPQLKRRFGSPYEEYLAAVPRWLPWR